MIMHSSPMILPSILFLIILSFFPPLSLSLFPNLTLSGDARLRNRAILLTQDLTCPPSSSSSSVAGAGTAFYANPIRFLDSSSNSAASFSSRFSLSVVPTPLCPAPDGVAFLIAADSTSFTRSPGHIALPISPFPFLALEFDTHFDPTLGDINDNHLGLDLNSPTSLISADFGSVGIVLKNGREVTVWIEYSNDSKTIRVWVGYSPTRRPANPLLVLQIDLSNTFEEFMYVGFSASNGHGSALHIVHKWRFTTFGLLPSFTPVDTISDARDCFVSSAENSSRVVGNPERRIAVWEMTLGLGAFACSILVIVGFVLMYKWRGRADHEVCCQVEMNRVPRRLSLGEIKLATMGFNPNRIIGEGASATVYKGSLPSGGEVAVKRFARAAANDPVCNPFTTEFATMAGCLRHKNLVRFHGWCCEADELVLVYEYLPNGTLAKLLHRTSNSQFVLPWKIRFQIVLGVASALTYLHEECESQIIHRDVKTCNIMLDAEFSAKLGDFGLAEVYEHSSVTREATIPAGTMGYLAPEYVYSGVPTVKTDVYSFGVVMLEVASGRRPVNEDGTGLVDRIWDLWEVGKLMEACDSMLMGKYKIVEMERMLMVGLLCVHPNHEKRPIVKEAARILKGEASLPLLPSKKPRVCIRPVFADDDDTRDVENHRGRDTRHDDSVWMTPKSQFS